eukprot:206285_1
MFVLQEIKWILDKKNICELVTFSEPSEVLRHLVKPFDFNCNLVDTERIVMVLSYSKKHNNIKFEVPLQNENGSSVEFRNKHLGIDKMQFEGYVHITDGPTSFLNLLFEINGKYEMYSEWLFDKKMDIAQWKSYDHIEFTIALCCTCITKKGNILNNTQIFDENIPGMTAFEEKKKKGNDLFKKKKFTEAYEYYNEAQDIASKSMKTLTKEMLAKLIIITYNNKAITLLKRGGKEDYDVCILCCNIILTEWDEFNQKATWRKVRALKLKGMPVAARKVCEEYLKHEPNDKKIQKLLKSI